MEAVEESKTMLVGERGRRCGREGIWGKMVGARWFPLLYDGTFMACSMDTCYPKTAVSCMQKRNAYTAPPVRVNGQAIDLAATSVVTSSEGFRQGSGEN